MARGAALHVMPFATDCDVGKPLSLSLRTFLGDREYDAIAEGPHKRP